MTMIQLKQNCVSILSSFALFIAFSGTAIAQQWKIDHTKSQLNFTANQTGSDVLGQFTQYDGQIIFDPKDLSTASVRINIDIDSVDTQDQQRDTTIKSADLFDAETYPKAIFKAENFRLEKDTQYRVDASLTLKDTTKKFTLPVTIVLKNNLAHATAALTIQRLDFGIGQGMFSTTSMVANPVTISFDVTASN